MRAAVAWAALGLALLAGCGDGRDLPDTGAENVILPPEASPATNAANASAAAGPSAAAEAPTDIPEAYRGEWNADLTACGSGLSDSRLRIGARSLAFHESAAEVRRVERVDARTIRVEADFQGEGERWSRTVQFRLSPEGDRLVMDDFARRRCPA